MAKIYLDSTNTDTTNGPEFLVSNNDVSVYGLAQVQAVRLGSGATNLHVDQTVERVVFNGVVGDYTFLQNGNTLKVYSAGAELLATIEVQNGVTDAGNDGTLLTFKDGTAKAVLGTGNIMTLGGATVDTDAPVHVSSPTLDPSLVSGTDTTTAPSLALTTGHDELSGTNGNDTFVARIFDNSNTLQSGDIVHGGLGTDTLKAYVGNSQNFAILAESDSVENLVIQAQAVSGGSSDNNMSKTNEVQVDAQLLTGVTYVEDNQSRADLLVEDLRLDFASRPHAITSDVTIAMVGTDPGHVDYGVYFDQHSLLAGASDTSVLALQLMDTRSYTAGGPPLKDSPYFGFAFELNGVHYQVGGDTPGGAAIDAAQTYDELLAAVKLAVSEVAGLKDVVTVTFGANFTVTDTLGTVTPPGKEILLTATGGSFTTTAVNDGWIAAGPVPPSSGLHTNMSTVSTHFDDLITSKIILDDVGRGNMGGDLVVGGLSVGDTDDCKGVEKFLVTVIKDSALQTMNSTNNKLQEVYIVNNTDTAKGPTNGNLKITGVVESGAHASGPSDISNNLFEIINDATHGFIPKFDPKQLYAFAPANLQFPNEIGVNTALPGTEVDVVTPTNVTGDQHMPGFGLYDLRVVDASTFVGKLDLTAVLTDSVVAKFMNRVDTATDPAADQTAKPFVYNLGTNDDKLALNISKYNMEWAGTNNREDFKLTISGNAGNDQISTQIGDGTGVDTSAWYINGKLNANLNIVAGTGNDTVMNKGAGDWKIDLGAGNDVLYADNSGRQSIVVLGEDQAPLTVASNAMWVFNAKSAAGTGAALAPYTSAPTSGNGIDITNLESHANNSHNTLFGGVGSSATTTSGLFKTSVTVHFEGFEKTLLLENTGYNTSDLQINQSLKNAINSDPVLNKMLLAQDGPGNTLVVSALVDGVRGAENGVYVAGVGVQNDFVTTQVVNDFHLTFQNVTATALTQADVTGYAAAHGITLVNNLTVDQGTIASYIADATARQIGLSSSGIVFRFYYGPN